MYQNPIVYNPGMDDKEAQEEFEDFYEDIFEELSKYGEIEEMNVCDNICDHLLGNVYVKFRREEDAERAIKALTGRFYNGKYISDRTNTE
jgi:splicing factor U2AF subunit